VAGGPPPARCATRTIVPGRRPHGSNGGFEVGEILGSGGFDVVDRATDPDHARNVAVKLLPAITDPTARRRFDRERRAMGRRSGRPDIAVVLTPELTEHDEPCPVMEPLPGGSILDRIAQGPMSGDEIIDIGVDLADALRVANPAMSKEPAGRRRTLSDFQRRLVDLRSSLGAPARPTRHPSLAALSTVVQPGPPAPCDMTTTGAAPFTGRRQEDVGLRTADVAPAGPAPRRPTTSTRRRRRQWAQNIRSPSLPPWQLERHRRVSARRAASVAVTDAASITAN
jgi:hypothetical protein